MLVGVMDLELANKPTRKQNHYTGHKTNNVIVKKKTIFMHLGEVYIVV